MQAWAEKGTTATESSSRGYGSSTLHFDEALSFLSKRKEVYEEEASTSNEFRTREEQKGFPATPANHLQPLFDDYSNTIPEDYNSSIYQQFTQPVTAYSRCYLPTYHQQSVADGSELLYFLNKTGYTDHIYDDTLNAGSKEYQSYRHQVDTQHALSERRKLQHQWAAELLSSEDIVEYLSKAEYTEDIYGIPILGELVREAKEELNTSDRNDHGKLAAVERLSMIRNHLMAEANGDTNIAAKNALDMNENDWSTFFL
ncbi:hypothetical protein BDF20DRAFT_912223 [Mycotypha africana]|uniref:uncharacterized protein n=1 Tax=Mycotypha africana TaxID=64632 RepID=UPI002301ACE7|nr:uncharacterized protein BDF20DRAFT_912223 [Mycotypha africana]KAI8982018.1 hypothetical protein BDF20DRAFT_912223 [Mycotypha africana]